MFGTAIYDEFVLPTNSEHFLSLAGLQTLATGGTVSPGKVMENGPGIGLQYPLFVNSKVAADTPDIRNRQLPVFMDPHTDVTKCSDAEFANITSGKASYELRLAALRYISETQLIEKIKAMPLISGSFRFNGHLTVANLFAPVEKISAYLTAADKQCTAQRHVADDSGLTEQVDSHVSFDPEWYVENAKNETFESVMMFQKAAVLHPGHVLRTIVEDGGLRRFYETLREYRITERAATMRFKKLLRDVPLCRPGWTLRLTTDIDKKGRKREMVAVERTGTTPPTALGVAS